LKRVLLLLDARHGFKQTDLTCMQDLVTMNYTDPTPSEENDIEDGQELVKPSKSTQQNSKGKKSDITWKLQVVLTKCDLVERSELARRVQLVREQLSDSFPSLRISNMPVLMLSALEGRGVAELHRDLASLVPPSASGNVPASSDAPLTKKPDLL
jgi:GTP-binding protein